MKALKDFETPKELITWVNSDSNNLITALGWAGLIEEGWDNEKQDAAYRMAPGADALWAEFPERLLAAWQEARGAL